MLYILYVNEEMAQRQTCQQVNKFDTKVLPVRLGVLFAMEEREHERLETGV